jgi:predicted enzyme related to lactoylglutathione lyase
LSTTPTTAPTLFFVEIRTADRAGLVAWYVETVGLAVVLDGAAGDFSLLAAGPARLAIKGRPSAIASGSIGLAFQVEDVATIRAKLVGRGVIVSEPKDSPEGYRSIHLADPMGHPIQLFQWLP